MARCVDARLGDGQTTAFPALTLRYSSNRLFALRPVCTPCLHDRGPSLFAYRRAPPSENRAWHLVELPTQTRIQAGSRLEKEVVPLQSQI